jgi:hypothetical protein
MNSSCDGLIEVCLQRNECNKQNAFSCFIASNPVFRTLVCVSESYIQSFLPTRSYNSFFSIEVTQLRGHS